MKNARLASGPLVQDFLIYLLRPSDLLMRDRSSRAGMRFGEITTALALPPAQPLCRKHALSRAARSSRRGFIGVLYESCRELSTLYKNVHMSRSCPRVEAYNCHRRLASASISESHTGIHLRPRSLFTLCFYGLDIQLRRNFTSIHKSNSFGVDVSSGGCKMYMQCSRHDVD